MKNDNVVSLQGPAEEAPSVKSVLDELVREGARRMLQSALEEEVSSFIERHLNTVTEQGRKAVVRNGHLPERDIVTGAGPLRVKQTRNPVPTQRVN